MGSFLAFLVGAIYFNTIRLLRARFLTAIGESAEFACGLLV
jgi:hypothetical protein